MHHRLDYACISTGRLRTSAHMITTADSKTLEAGVIRKRLAYAERGEGDVEHQGEPEVPNELGYSRTLVHLPRASNGVSFVGAIYVNRSCDGGCGRTLKFTPLPGVVRTQWCSVCKRVTGWRVVA